MKGVSTCPTVFQHNAFLASLIHEYNPQMALGRKMTVQQQNCLSYEFSCYMIEQLNQKLFPKIFCFNVPHSPLSASSQTKAFPYLLSVIDIEYRNGGVPTLKITTFDVLESHLTCHGTLKWNNLSLHSKR